MQSGAGLDAPITDVANGVFDDNTLAVVGDYTMAVLGLRQDMTYKLLDQAVITDDTGKIIYNLPQQDMLALRVTFRAAFAVAPSPARLRAPARRTRSRCAEGRDAVGRNVGVASGFRDLSPARIRGAPASSPDRLRRPGLL